MRGEDSSATSSAKDIRNRNPYVIISFVLGFLSGFYVILTGIEYYLSGWPAHGPVGILGVVLIITGLPTILGSILVLSRRTRMAGAVLILLFGLFGNMQITYDLVNSMTRLLLPVLGFIFALYAVKQKRNTH